MSEYRPQQCSNAAIKAALRRAVIIRQSRAVVILSLHFAISVDWSLWTFGKRVESGQIEHKDGMEEEWWV